MTHILKFWANLGLQARLLCVIGLFLIGIGVVEPLYHVHMLAQQYRQDMAQKLSTTLEGLQLGVQDSVVIGDSAAIQQELRLWIKFSDIEHAEWRSQGIHPMRAQRTIPLTAPAWFGTYLGLSSMSRASPIVLGPQTYGEVEIGLSSSRWTNRLWSEFKQDLLYLSIQLVLIFIALAFVLRTGLGSLSSLMQAAREFGAGHYGARGKLNPGMAPEAREIVQALNHTAEYLEQIMHAVQGASDAISICKLDGQALFVNRAFIRLFGHTLEQVNAAGGVARALAHPALLEEACPMVKQGKCWGGRLEITTREHGLRSVQVKAEPVFDEQQRVSGLMAVFSDVTEQQRSARMTERLGRLFDNSLNEIYVFDAATLHFVQVNRGACANLGYTQEELRALTAYDLKPEIGREAFERLVTPLRQGQTARLQFTTVHRRKNGSEYPVEVSLQYAANEQPAVFYGIVEDITARKQAEEALRESIAHYHGIVSHIPGVVFQLMRTLGGTLHFPYVSAAALSILDIDAVTIQADIEQLLGRFVGAERDAFLASLQRSASRMEDWQWEGRMCGASGQRWLSLRASPYQRGDGSVIWDGVMWDITAEKQSHLDMEQSRDQLRELSSYLQDAREDEKAAIARDIHDELGGTLSALKMDAYWLEQRLAPLDPSLQAKAGAMVALLDGAVRTVRRIATELRPTVLDDLGLPATLEWLGREFLEHSGVRCQVMLPSIEPELTPQQALALFRIAQESLTNIARHAGASEASLAFGVEDERMILEVRDNGVGFDADRIPAPTSRGIRGMIERAHLLGGDIQIDAGPGQGATIRAMLPLYPDQTP